MSFPFYKLSMLFLLLFSTSTFSAEHLILTVTNDERTRDYELFYAVTQSQKLLALKQVRFEWNARQRKLVRGTQTFSIQSLNRSYIAIKEGPLGIDLIGLKTRIKNRFQGGVVSLKMIRKVGIFKRDYRTLSLRVNRDRNSNWVLFVKDPSDNREKRLNKIHFFVRRDGGGNPKGLHSLRPSWVTYDSDGVSISEDPSLPQRPHILLLDRL